VTTLKPTYKPNDSLAYLRGDKEIDATKNRNIGRLPKEVYE